MKAEYNAVEKTHGIRCRETIAMRAAFLHTQSRDSAASVLGCLFKKICGANNVGRESASTQSQRQTFLLSITKDASSLSLGFRCLSSNLTHSGSRSCGVHLCVGSGMRELAQRLVL